jgi:hypothetical protein
MNSGSSVRWKIYEHFCQSRLLVNVGRNHLPPSRSDARCATHLRASVDQTRTGSIAAPAPLRSAHESEATPTIPFYQWHLGRDHTDLGVDRSQSLRDALGVFRNLLNIQPLQQPQLHAHTRIEPLTHTAFHDRPLHALTTTAPSSVACGMNGGVSNRAANSLIVSWSLASALASGTSHSE